MSAADPGALPAMEAAATTSTPPAQRITPWRMCVVYGLLAFIILGHLFEVVVQHENWPFSPYQMWSTSSLGWEVNREMLRGVTDEPVPREVALGPGQLSPIPYQMVVVNMQTAAKAITNNDPDKAQQIIGGLLSQYNTRVNAGKNVGPKFKALRLYRVTWKMDTDATADSRQNPIKTELVFPVLTGEQKLAAVPPISTRIASEFGDDSNGE